MSVIAVIPRTGVPGPEVTVNVKKSPVLSVADSRRVGSRTAAGLIVGSLAGYWQVFRSSGQQPSGGTHPSCHAQVPQA